MRLDARSLHQRVPSIKELADVSSVVLTQDKLSAGMKLFETIKLEDKIVENKHTLAYINTLSDLFSSVHSLHLIVWTLFNLGRHNGHIFGAIGPSMAALKHEHKQDESADTDVAKRHFIVV